MVEEEMKVASFSKLNLPSLHISTPTIDSPEHPSTPPFHASASVPFKWEEQPGKPRRCSATTSSSVPQPPKSLEPPPCMNGDRFTKTPSPTTVLDGPYNFSRPKFSSFRFFSDSHGHDLEGTDFEALLGAKKSGGRTKSRGFLGKLMGKRGEFEGGSCRFSPASVGSCESDERFKTGKSNCGVKMIGNGSFSSTKSSHLWTSIYQGIKQVMQWKSSKKSNKQESCGM